MKDNLSEAWIIKDKLNGLLLFLFFTDVFGDLLSNIGPKYRRRNHQAIRIARKVITGRTQGALSPFMGQGRCVAAARLLPATLRLKPNLAVEIGTKQ